MIAAALVFLCASPTFHDGDNIRCGGRTYRLARIDAPEFEDSPRCRRPRLGVICDDRRARAARDHLRRVAGGRRITCTVVDASPRVAGFQATDRYGRPVVRCRAGNIDLGSEQVHAGYARPWP